MIAKELENLVGLPFLRWFEFSKTVSLVSDTLHLWDSSKAIYTSAIAYLANPNSIYLNLLKLLGWTDHSPNNNDFFPYFF